MKGKLELLREFIRPIKVAVLLIVLILGAVVSGVLEAFSPGLGVAFTDGVSGWFKAIPDPYYQLLGALGVAYIASRGLEKNKQVEVTAKYDPPARQIDDPEGGA